MKKYLLKAICLMALVITSLPITAYDYLKIYFKDGHTERHFMKLVESIYATKYDLEGNLHDDYQMQQIVMQDTTYSYYLIDIDSISFKKVYEEQVKKDVENVSVSLTALFEQCSTIEEMAARIDDIKNIEGVENVWRAGTDIVVQIRDWHKVVFTFPLLLNDAMDSMEKMARSLKNNKRKVPKNENNDSLKVVIAFQMIDDSRFDPHEEKLRKLYDEFDDMGFDVTFIPNESGEILDFDFYTDRLFNYDIVVLQTHGGYDGQKHSFVTATELPLSFYAWDFYIEKKLDIDFCDLTILFPKEKGEILRKPKCYLSISEDCIKRSKARFSTDRPHFVYMAACSSLEGKSTLTHEHNGDSESFIGSDAVAKIFFDKGADIYMGYDKSTAGMGFAAYAFFHFMLKGYSQEAAFYYLDDDDFKHETHTEEQASLIDLVNPKLTIDPRKYYFYNTHTIEKTEQELNDEYKTKQQLELKGSVPCYDLDESGLEFGFRISTKPNIDETTNGIDILSNDAHYSGKKYGEVFFSGVFNPEPEITYYYRATTFDGINFNWGEERSFTVPTPADIPAEAKDLGLPSGTKWASYNVGATASEEYGEYFAWGELKEKDVFNESNYQFCKNGIYANIGDDIGGTKYDVASERWGGEWMMPNKQMMQELYEYCTTKWTTQNDVYGTLFTGPNGESIFLPAAGYRQDDQQQQVGVWGDYWTSTASEANTYSAYELYFKDGLINCDYVYNDNPTYRRNGHTVRPVIPGLQLTSNGPLSILMGDSETVSVRYGSGSYRYEVDKEGIVSVEITGSTITIHALSGGDAVVTVIDNKGGKATISVAVKAIPEAKDLGLPSGTKWATFNIGANCPEDYGEYYAWGENGVKDTYSESTYEYCKNGMYTNIGKDIRGTGYDTAREKWGGEWMMPSTTQFNELISNCTSEWTTINGVKGRKFTSKINGEYIFFPAAGYIGSKLTNTGTYGYYWSGNIDPDNAEKAYTMISKNATPSMPVNPRCLGFSVRPVISGLELSATGTLSMFEGNSRTVTIRSGSGSYQPEVDQEGVVSVNITGTTITINALKIGDVVFTVTDTKGGQKANIIINVRAVPKAIDLGLPSGTKWANVNVGANSPEEFGDYYAWGETETKSVYTTSTYKYYKNSSYVDIGYDIRGSEYDAAQAKWGDKWKMPSSTQFKELLDNCISKWTTVNGVNGLKFISKINGDSIFLPAGGYKKDDLYNKGSYGNYWTSTRKPSDVSGAEYLYFSSSGYNWSTLRYRGHTVRPVIRDKSEEEDPRMDEVLPEVIRDKFRDHMPIYTGSNPPNIEGSYLIEPYTVVYCEDGCWDPGHVIDPYKIRFFNQSSTDNTIDMIDYYLGETYTYNKGKGAFISGNGTHFTAYFTTEGSYKDVYTKKTLVVSGTKTEKGIEDLYYGFVMLEKGSDPDKKVMDVGVFRSFKDGDGLSEPTTWEFESNARQTEPEDKSESETMEDGLGRRKVELAKNTTDSEGRIPAAINTE